MSQDLLQKKMPPTRPPPPRLANNATASTPSPPPRPSRPPASSQHKLQERADKPPALLSPEKRERRILPPHPLPPLSTSYQQQNVERKTTEDKRDSSSLSLTSPPPPPYSSSTLRAKREKKDPPPARPDYSPVFIVKRRSKSSENVTLANSPFLAVKTTGSGGSSTLSELPPRSKTPQNTYYTPPPVTRILSHKDKDATLTRPSPPVPFPRRNKNKGPVSRPPEPLPRSNIIKEIQSRTPPIPRERSRADKETVTNSLPYTARTYPPPLSLTKPVPLFSRGSLSPSHSVPEDIYALPNATGNRALSIQSEPDAIEWYASSDDAVHKNELEQDSSYAVPHTHGVVAHENQETIEWYASTDDIGSPSKEGILSTTGVDISEDGYMVMSSISGHVGSDSGIGGEEIEGGDNMYLPLNALERDEENTYSIPISNGSIPIDTIVEGICPFLSLLSLPLSIVILFLISSFLSLFHFVFAPISLSFFLSPFLFILSEPPLYTDPSSLDTYISSSVPTNIYMPLQDTNDTNGECKENERREIHSCVRD